jgi:hypothetical protein
MVLKLGLFPPFGDVKETPNLSVPLERTNLYPMNEVTASEWKQ